ncbi:MAG: glycosyltransferase [Mariniphaga sp.]|nr:glycosyltransferase [Mariniphaga sp.]
MNIVIVGTFPPYRGGIADFNAALSAELKLIHTVHAINFTTQYPSLFFPGKSQYKPDHDSADEEIDRLISSINPFSWIKTARRINVLEPDLVIFRYWMPFFAPALGMVARLIKARSKTKILVICDNIIPHEQHWFDQPITRYLFNKADYFMVMSRAVEKDLLMLYPNARYRYSPHPLYNIFGDKIDQELARKQLGFRHEKLILFFGIIRHYKGLDVLLEAIPKLRSILEDFRVLAVGECYENTEKYTDLIKQLEIEDLVDLRMDFIPDTDIHLYFSAADVVVLPYRTATQSGIVSIAYHFDCPVIVSDVGGLPEIIDNGKTGYVVTQGPEAVREGIVTYFKDREVTDFNANIAAYKERLSWSAYAKLIEELVE